MAVRDVKYPLLFGALVLWFLMFLTASAVSEETAGVVNTAGPREEIQKIRLQVLKEDLQKEIEKYVRLREEIQRAKRELEEKREESISRVAKIYENMPPEEAARKLEKLDESTVVLIIGALKARTAGRIMAQMSPEKAASVSRKLLSKARYVEKYLGK